MISIHTTRSGMISEIGYDESTEELYVTFSNGGKYRYKDVPKNVFDSLISAESEGKYFAANIKNKFEYEKC